MKILSKQKCGKKPHVIAINANKMYLLICFYELTAFDLQISYWTKIFKLLLFLLVKTDHCSALIGQD